MTSANPREISALDANQVTRPVRAGTQKLQTIQALRFVAALLVVCTHSTLYANERLDPSTHVWQFGTIGVDVFFTISGLVMVVSSKRLLTDPDGAATFAARRFIRIAPLYWVMTTIKVLTLLAGSGIALHATLGPRVVVLSYLFLPSTNAEGSVEPIWGVGWTLIFEMFFYALFALGMRLKVSPVVFSGTILCALAIASAFRTDSWPAATFYANIKVVYFLGGMLIGLYLLRRDRSRLIVGLSLLVTFYVLCEVLRAIGPERFLAEDVIKPVCVVAVVLACALLEPLVGRRLPQYLVYLGAASYSLYLVHPLIAPGVPTLLNHLDLKYRALSVPLSVAVAIVVSVVVYRFVEEPSTRWLQAGWERRRAQRLRGVAKAEA